MNLRKYGCKVLDEIVKEGRELLNSVSYYRTALDFLSFYYLLDALEKLKTHFKTKPNMFSCLINVGRNICLISNKNVHANY